MTSSHDTARAAFRDLIGTLTAELAGRPLDAALEEDLNRRHPAGSPVYEAIFSACRAGIEAGWMCAREHGGIRYGRVLEAEADLQGYSVDVVDMNEVAGPHHRHPGGEVDLVMPLAAAQGLQPGGEARFDGQPAGWKVYGAGTAHRPTVAGGRALVLYLLPGGAIEFTRA